MRPEARIRRGRARLPAIMLSEHGAVVAEFAIALPAVVLMLAVALGCSAMGVQQVRAQDAAADVARLLGRGDADGAAGFAAKALPGAGFTVAREGGVLCVQLSAPARVILTLPIVQVRGTACALDDQGFGAG